MNKGELISQMANDAGVTKSQATECLNSFCGAVESSLKGGDKLTLIGFGTFSISARAARTGRNPQTGKEIQIAAKNIVKFKAGKALAEKM